MSLVMDSPVHSSTNEDLEAFLCGHLTSDSSYSSAYDEAEDDRDLESKRYCSLQFAIKSTHGIPRTGKDHASGDQYRNQKT